MADSESGKQRKATPSPDRFIHRCSKFLYYTCRALQLFRFKYDRAEERLQLLPFQTWRRNCLGALLGVLVIGGCAVSEPRQKEFKELFDFKKSVLEDKNYRAQDWGLSVLTYSVNLCTVLRLCWFLIGKKHRRPLQLLVDETLRLRRRTLDLTARDVCVAQSFKKFLHIKVIIYLFMIVNFIILYRTWPFYHTFQELFYCAYQTMQLTLLSLYRNLNAHSKQFLELKDSSQCRAQNRRSVKRRMQLLIRLHRVHALFVREFSWFPSLVYYEITDCVMWSYLFISCGYTAKSLKAGSKLYLITLLMVFILFPGRILLPGVNMFCLSLLNDELCREAQLSNDYHTIAGIRELHGCACNRCKETQRLRDVYILRMKVQPMVGMIFRNTTLNRAFGWDYIATTVGLSLTFALYHLSFQYVVMQCFGC